MYTILKEYTASPYPTSVKPRTVTLRAIQPQAILSYPVPLQSMFYLLLLSVSIVTMIPPLLNMNPCTCWDFCRYVPIYVCRLMCSLVMSAKSNLFSDITYAYKVLYLFWHNLPGLYLINLKRRHIPCELRCDFIQPYSHYDIHNNSSSAYDISFGAWCIALFLLLSKCIHPYCTGNRLINLGCITPHVHIGWCPLYVDECINLKSETMQRYITPAHETRCVGIIPCNLGVCSHTEVRVLNAFTLRDMLAEAGRGIPRGFVTNSDLGMRVYIAFRELCTLVVCLLLEGWLPLSVDNGVNSNLLISVLYDPMMIFLSYIPCRLVFAVCLGNEFYIIVTVLQDILLPSAHFDMGPGCEGVHLGIHLCIWSSNYRCPCLLDVMRDAGGIGGLSQVICVRKSNENL